MAVTNGQPANQDTFNNAFVSKTQDSTMSSIFTLSNSDAASGSSVTNVQREFNSLNSFLGKTLNTVKTDLPVWTDDDVGSAGDDLFERTDAISTAFTDLPAYIPNATPVNTGLVSIGSQSFGGRKTFENGIRIEFDSLYLGPRAFEFEDNSTSTGANATLPEPEASLMRLTNASLTSVEGIIPDLTFGSIGQLAYLVNVTGNTVRFLNDTGTAENRILTGTGSPVDVQDGGMILVWRDSDSARWRILGGSGGGGGAGGGFDNLAIESSPFDALEIYESDFKEYVFDPDTTQSVRAVFQVPQGYNAGTQIQMDFAWSNPATTGDVTWRVDVKLFKSGSALRGTATDTDIDQTSVTVDGTANEIQTQTMDITDSAGLVDAASVEAGDVIVVNLARFGSESSDTNTSNSYVIANSLRVRTA